MSGNTEVRRAEVLGAIVTDYIASQEPVGSKALVERHNLGVSSATIRNDMAVLEAEGYITQEHASSGRVPTEKGYRFFVDSISQVKPLSRAERRAILGFLEGGVDLEDVLRRSVQLLSQLTRQVAVVQVPTFDVSRVRHCEVVQLADVRLLLILITDAGRVEQRNVELAAPMDPGHVGPLREQLNRAMEGKTLADASTSIADLAANAPVEFRDAVIRCCTVLLEQLFEQPPDRLILAGASNLTRGGQGLFPAALPQVLEALEEQVVVLKLLSAAQEISGVSVSIGAENEDVELRGTSVVSAGYGTSRVLGGLGVVGPTYMDYPGTMASVAAVARYVGRVVGDG